MEEKQVTPASSSTSTDRNLYMLLYNDEGADVYESKPNYAEGKLFEFTPDYLTDGSQDIMVGKLEYIWDVMQNGTGGINYKAFPSTYFTKQHGSTILISGFLYSYPQPELQATPDFQEFIDWWVNIVTSWGLTHGIKPNWIKDEADSANSGSGDDKYFRKINFKIP